MQMDAGAWNRLKCLVVDAAAAAALFTCALLVKSVVDFSRAGPRIREQVEAHYLGFTAWAVAEQALVVFVLTLFMALSGRVLLEAWGPSSWRTNRLAGVVAGWLAIGFCSAIAFLDMLYRQPGLLVANWLYDVGHLVRLWFLTRDWPLAVGWAVFSGAVVLAVIQLAARFACQRWVAAVAVVAPAVVVAVLILDPLDKEPTAADGAIAASAARNGGPYNILLIGSDTLRADRLGIYGYERSVSPAIDRVAKDGAWFARMYVPIGRTAPSMTTLLTGRWPRRTGVTSNFIPDSARTLAAPALPAVFARHGYRTMAIGDWAASDLGKIGFGFQRLETAPDQWNIKNLLRQGPKDLRLYLSLFTQNEWSRRWLPHMYYLASRPLTSEMGRATRRALDEFARRGEPFFLLSFIATTHPPFSVEDPYYSMFSGEDYSGRSKFSMTGVFTPEAIARAQAMGAEAFDVQQIVDLYDGCVARFDHEVERILGYLRKTGLDRNTVVVIFSDHGTDLFEKGTWGQGNTVFGKDPSNHVPFIVLDPGGRLQGRIDATVRSVDIAPTLLELAGLPPEALEADGVSLLPLASGKDRRPRAAYLATGAWLARVKGMAEDHLEVPPLMELLEIRDYDSGTISLSEEGVRLIEQARDRAIRYGRWKLVRIPLKDGRVRHALYDLEADDDVDVSARFPEVTACLARTLDRWASDALAETWPQCPAGSPQGEFLSASRTPLLSATSEIAAKVHR